MALSGKVALVTGAARGIGEAISRALAKAGAACCVADVDEVGAKTVVKDIADEGGRAVAVACDVTDPDQVGTMVDRCVAELGRLDILVNNAGITRDALGIRLKPADWDIVMGVNLTGTWLCSQAALKVMLKQRSGRIINISSVVGVMGNVGQANYAASKAGVIGLTKALAREGALREVTVNAIAPGFIDTAMTQALPEKIREELLSHIPLGRLGSPEDVAHAVLFLAGDGACYITGQVIHINGGMLMP
ncbi:MAG: 3-oxoacyl-[acyl-carrier-protein] reductase [Nitrospinae bacterium]|nr:3-oxoacyl-[acyl-carrier-protein] reductase [Nitrospinota bacterium]